MVRSLVGGIIETIKFKCLIFKSPKSFCVGEFITNRATKICLLVSWASHLNMRKVEKRLLLINLVARYLKVEV